MKSRFAWRIGESALLCLFFFLANLRSFVFWEMFPDPAQPGGPAWIELVMWAVALALLGGLLWRERSHGVYFARWRSQPVLIVFLALCGLSSLWSISPAATIYRSLALLAATLVAAFVGLRYSLQDFLQILYRFSAVVVVGGYLLILAVPSMGTDLHEPYNGAWRGLFWHKNHLGAIAPLLSTTFLIAMLSRPQNRQAPRPLLTLLLYLLSLGMVVFARSAAGYILVLLLHFGVAIAYAWLNTRHLLRPSHYWLVGALMTGSAILILLNLDFAFGLFNRESTLTGRVPLWQHLIDNWISRRPWFGYGYGSVWLLSWFRTSLQEALSWGYPVKIGDNALIDLLLYLGIAGVLVFSVLFAQIGVRAARVALRSRSLADFFPLIFVLFCVAANLSFSLLLETELMTWSLLVALLFMFDVSGEPVGRQIGSDSPSS